MNGILLGLADVLTWLFWAYRIVLFVAVVLNISQANPYNGFVQFIRSITEPLFAWFRRRLPWLVYQGFDFSPLAVWLLTIFLEKAIVYNLWVWGSKL